MSEYTGPVSMTDLATDLGVSVETVSMAASKYCTEHGDRLTYADVDSGVPYNQLTADAVAAVRDAVQF